MITRSVDINAPIEQAFDTVADDQKLKLWMEGLVETVYPTPYDRANPVGTRFKQRIREGRRVTEYEGEVTAFERPRHLGVRISNPQFAVQVDYRFTAIPGGTRLDYSADMAYHTAVARIMGTLFGWMTNRILNKQMRRLKEVAERGDAVRA